MVTAHQNWKNRKLWEHNICIKHVDINFKLSNVQIRKNGVWRCRIKFDISPQNPISPPTRPKRPKTQMPTPTDSGGILNPYNRASLMRNRHIYIYIYIYIWICAYIYIYIYGESTWLSAYNHSNCVAWYFFKADADNGFFLTATHPPPLAWSGQVKPGQGGGADPSKYWFYWFPIGSIRFYWFGIGFIGFSTCSFLK